MLWERVELSRLLGHTVLNRACLPVPAPEPIRDYISILGCQKEEPRISTGLKKIPTPVSVLPEQASKSVRTIAYQLWVVKI